MQSRAVWQQDGCLSDLMLTAVLEGDSETLKTSGDDVLVVIAHSDKCQKCRERKLRISRKRHMSLNSYWPPRRSIGFDDVARGLTRAQDRLDQVYPKKAPTVARETSYRLGYDDSYGGYRRSLSYYY